MNNHELALADSQELVQALYVVLVVLVIATVWMYYKKGECENEMESYMKTAQGATIGAAQAAAIGAAQAAGFRSRFRSKEGLAPNGSNVGPCGNSWDPTAVAEAQALGISMGYEH